MSKFSSLVAVIPVADHAAATTWYASWLGRDADVIPMEGTAEWQITESAWIQVGETPAGFGPVTVVLGVEDLEAQLRTCRDRGVETSDIEDYGFIRTGGIQDPEGNTILFVQEMGES